MSSKHRLIDRTNEHFIHISLFFEIKVFLSLTFLVTRFYINLEPLPLGVFKTILFFKLMSNIITVWNSNFYSRVLPIKILWSGLIFRHKIVWLKWINDRWKYILKWIEICSKGRMEIIIIITPKIQAILENGKTVNP